MTTPAPNASNASTEEHSFEHRGCSLFYRAWGPHGAERTLILCHGFSSNGTRWREFAENTTLGADWRILAPDLRGHGRSVYRGPLRAEDWVEDLCALMDREKVHSAVLGGHCLGANTALRFSVAVPGRTAGLVLVEPMFTQALEGKLARLHRLRGILPVLAALVRGLNRLGVRRRRLPEVDLGKLDRQFRAIMNASDSHTAVRKRYGSPRHDMLHMSLSAYLQALHETVRPLPDPARIPVPTLALLSAGGLFGSPEITRELLARIPEITLHELEALHWIPTEQPEAMQHHLERWLTGLFL